MSCSRLRRALKELGLLWLCSGKGRGGTVRERRGGGEEDEEEEEATKGTRGQAGWEKLGGEKDGNSSQRQK